MKVIFVRKFRYPYGNDNSFRQLNFQRFPKMKRRHKLVRHTFSKKPIKFPIHITIPGNPVPMYRPRFNRHGHTYNPRVMVNYERNARLFGLSQYKHRPLSNEPLFVKALVFVMMHKNWSKRKKREMEDRFVIKRPDLDNYGKDIVDAFNGVLYADDNLMAEEFLAKMYSKRPRIEFYVQPIDQIKIE